MLGLEVRKKGESFGEVEERTEEGNVVGVLKCRYLSERVKLEKVRGPVFPFGHVNGNELERNVFLQQTGQDSGHGSGHGWTVHFHCRRCHVLLCLKEERKEGRNSYLCSFALSFFTLILSHPHFLIHYSQCFIFFIHSNKLI